MEKKQEKKWLNVLRIIKNIVLGTVIAFLTAVLIITLVSRISGNTPSIFGFSLFRVSSGSMTPELEVGDIILVRECDGTTVKTGDIVSYTATSGEMSGRLVTHRVVKAPYSENGDFYIVTKGDANPDNDKPISVSQITGKMIVKLDLIKHLFDFFATPWGLLTLIALIIAAFFNEIVIFVKTLFGIGFEPEPKESVDQIIERYKAENQPAEAAEPASEDSDSGTTEPE